MICMPGFVDTHWHLWTSLFRPFVRADVSELRADIILVRTTDINMSPVGDPYEALVSLAQPNNVDTVIVDGPILRHAGKFMALDHAKVVREAREAAAALRSKAKWPA
jgi:cytosine/adenosine deaminase-related metal-dependent hydrolase